MCTFEYRRKFRRNVLKHSTRRRNRRGTRKDTRVRIRYFCVWNSIIVLSIRILWVHPLEEIIHRFKRNIGLFACFRRTQCTKNIRETRATPLVAPLLDTSNFGKIHHRTGFQRGHARVLKNKNKYTNKHWPTFFYPRRRVVVFDSFAATKGGGRFDLGVIYETCWTNDVIPWVVAKGMCAADACESLIFSVSVYRGDSETNISIRSPNSVVRIILYYNTGTRHIIIYLCYAHAADRDQVYLRAVIGFLLRNVCLMRSRTF